MKIAIPLVLLLAFAAHAQDDQRPPIPIHFDNGSVDIMPGLTGAQRYQLKRGQKRACVDTKRRKRAKKRRRTNDERQRSKTV